MLAVEDAFGDVATVLCEFGYGSNLRTAARHGVAVQIDQANFSAAVDATLIDDVDDTVHDLRFGAEHAHDDFRLVEPGWAGAVLSRAFARTDLIPSTEVADGFAGTRALALARVRTLPATPDPLPVSPEPTPERRDAVVAEFRHSPEAADLFAPDESAPDASDAIALDADQVTRLIVDFAVSRDPGDLIRVSPARWEAFLAADVPRGCRGGVRGCGASLVRVGLQAVWDAAARPGRIGHRPRRDARRVPAGELARDRVRTADDR